MSASPSDLSTRPARHHSSAYGRFLTSVGLLLILGGGALVGAYFAKLLAGLRLFPALDTELGDTLYYLLASAGGLLLVWGLVLYRAAAQLPESAARVARPSALAFGLLAAVRLVSPISRDLVTAAGFVPFFEGLFFTALALAFWLLRPAAEPT